MKLILGLLGIFWVFPAHALTILQDIQVNTHGDEIQIRLSDKVDRTRITTEAIGDIFQISLAESSIYPAKMVPVQNAQIAKIFAYQYSPKVVRFRISLKGKAEDLKDLIQLSAEDKTLRIKFLTHPTKEATKETDELAENDNLLQEKILKNTPATPVLEKLDRVPEKSEKSAPTQEHADKEKGIPSVGVVFLKLAGVLGLFLLGVVAWGFRSKKLSSIPKILKGNLGLGERIIQVVSTHYLGPKKSLVVVRIAQKTLVLGVTQESIQLITQLPEKPSSLSKSEGDSFDEDGENEFEGVFDSEKTRPSIKPSIDVKSRIKSRLEGLKPL